MGYLEGKLGMYGKVAKRDEDQDNIAFKVSKFNGGLQIYRQEKTILPKAGNFSTELVQLLHRWLVFLRKLQVLEDQ